MGETVNFQHKGLAAGRWSKMTLREQMANIGSEVNRALNWQKKGNKELSRKAAARALELLDLSLDCVRPFHRLKEIARVREAIVDYFYGTNQFFSNEALWRKYFDHFVYAARPAR